MMYANSVLFNHFRLLSLLENILGSDKIQQLETLFNIMTCDSFSADKIRKENYRSDNDLFSIDNLLSPTMNETSSSSWFKPQILSTTTQKQKADWDFDYRGNYKKYIIIVFFSSTCM